MTGLVRRSPLAALYREQSAHVQPVGGWEMAIHFGDLAAEKRALQEGCVLVDWSHIGKIQIRGGDAADQVERLRSGARRLAPLRAIGDEDLAILRLAVDEFLVLCESVQIEQQRMRLEEQGSAICDCSGALGALLLAGARRHEVVERSAAMNLSARAVGSGSVVQTTLHTIPCTVYRGAAWDLYLQARDYTQSLYDALMDVGHGVGLVASGLGCVPTNLWAGANHG